MSIRLAALAALLALLAGISRQGSTRGPAGKKTYIHIGTYTTQGALESDIQHYTLGT